MTFLEKLRKDKMQAMREKDKVREGVLSLMMSAILLAEKEKHAPLTDEEALRFVSREAKQTRDALDMTPESRSDLIEELKKKTRDHRGLSARTDDGRRNSCGNPRSG